MTDALPAFTVLPGVLDPEDLGVLKAACREAIDRDDAIPSYVLIDRLDDPVVAKIQNAVEAQLGEEVFYLNDFYLYSDGEFGAPWHMDTELFTFARCINVWVLLSPDAIDPPLACIDGLNGTDEVDFHSCRIEGEEAQFVNYRTRKRERRTLDDLEFDRVDAPPVSSGDVLLLDPRRFHRTLTTVPKHALVFKFLLRTADGFMSKFTVPPMFWAEISIFTELVEASDEWSDVLDGLRQSLQTEEGREALGAGFFPEQMDRYREAVRTLT